MERGSYYDPLFDFRPEDFLYVPEPLPPDGIEYRPSHRPMDEGPECHGLVEGMREWCPGFGVGICHDHLNMVSGWLKGQHCVIPYDPEYVTRWKLGKEPPAKDAESDILGLYVE
jgi:hypothetical protein